MNEQSSNPIDVPVRSKFITPNRLTEGTITEVNVNQDPFHCTIKIQPKDQWLIGAEGRYSDHEVSLGKLKRNLVHLKYAISDVEDIITAVESLEKRECLFRVDKSGWVSWIARLIPLPAPPAPEPEYDVVKSPIRVEVFFERVSGSRSIYRMEDDQGRLLGWAVGPTGSRKRKPHGWVLDLESQEAALEVLKSRKISP